MELHESLYALGLRLGREVFEDPDSFRGALDDFLDEDSATTGDINLLVDAVRLGAFAVDDVDDRQRGAGDRRGRGGREPARPRPGQRGRRRRAVGLRGPRLRDRQGQRRRGASLPHPARHPAAAFTAAAADPVPGSAGAAGRGADPAPRSPARRPGTPPPRVPCPPLSRCTASRAPAVSRRLRVNVPPPSSWPPAQPVKPRKRKTWPIVLPSWPCSPSSAAERSPSSRCRTTARVAAADGGGKPEVHRPAHRPRIRDRALRARWPATSARDSTSARRSTRATAPPRRWSAPSATARSR